jgi:hypothetical protein
MNEGPLPLACRIGDSRDALLDQLAGSDAACIKILGERN